MRKTVYFAVMVIVLLSSLATTCAGPKAQPQLLSASETTCSVRNNGPTGDVKVIFYQVPEGNLSSTDRLLCKQWVVFTLAEGEDITLDFSIITDSSQVGSGRYYVSGPLPQGAYGGSKEAHYTVAFSGTGPGQSCIEKASGNILKEFESPDCYHSGFHQLYPSPFPCGYLLGFRVE